MSIYFNLFSGLFSRLISFWLFDICNDDSIIFGHLKKKKSVLQSKGGPIHHSSSDHYYSPPHGPKDDRNWSPHMDSYELMVGAFPVALLRIINISFIFSML